MKVKKQVVVIHGGDFFDSREEFVESLKKEEVTLEDLSPSLKKNWKETLQSDLGDTYEILRPEMPLKDHARYEEWKIWFDKVVPFLKDDVVLVGHSLGGIFLARYLGENTLPVKACGLILLAPYFGDTDTDSGWTLPRNLEKLNVQVSNVTIIQSKDDTIIPMSHAESYKKLIPQANLNILQDKGHFFALKHFPELVQAIRELP